MKTTLMFLALAALVVMPGAAEAKRYSLALDFGQDVLVTGKDDVGIRAQCVQNEGGNDVIRVYAVTANDAVLRGALYGYPGDGLYLTAVTPVPSSVVTVMAYATGTSLVYSQSDAGTLLNLTTMHGYTFSAESGVLGLNSGGSDCLLSIEIGEVKKFKATF